MGGLAVYTGLENQETADVIGDTEQTAIADLEAGRVAVNGTARPAAEGRTIERPFAGGDALALRVDVEYLEERDPDEDTGPDYIEAADVSVSEAIVIDDGTGTARVEPPASLDFPSLVAGSTERRVDDADALLDDLEPLVDRRPELDPSVLDRIREEQPRTRWRYTVQVIEPRQDVYVLGKASQQSGGDANLVVDAGDSQEFVLSEFSGEETESRVSTSSKLFIAGGAVFVVVGIVFPGFFFWVKVL